MATEFTRHSASLVLRLGIRTLVPSVRPRRLTYSGHFSLLCRRRFGPRFFSIQSTRAASSSSTQTVTRNTDPPQLRTTAAIHASKSDSDRPLLQPNNLFHSFSNSPSPEIRQQAAFIKQNAFCPHPSHQQTRVPMSPHDSESRKSAHAASQAPAHSQFECPDCGVMTHSRGFEWSDPELDSV